MLIYTCIEYLVKVGATINGRDFLPINRNLKGESACVEILDIFALFWKDLGVFSFHPLIIYLLCYYKQVNIHNILTYTGSRWSKFCTLQ